MLTIDEISEQVNDVETTEHTAGTVAANGADGAGTAVTAGRKDEGAAAPVGVWTAINRARHSAGSIHDDATARKLGFRGGFVGGVTLISYACEAWRRAHGLPLALRPIHLTAELRAPVYEGEQARVWAAEDGARWSYRIDTEGGPLSTTGVIEAAQGEWSAPAATGAGPSLDGVDLGDFPPAERAFDRAEVRAYYQDVLGTVVPEAGDLPVSIGMWSNPMTPIIARLQATHTTVHYGSEMVIRRLPLADEPCTFLTSVAAVTPRGAGKALVHVRCEVRDGSGRPLALILHRSAVRQRT